MTRLDLSASPVLRDPSDDTGDALCCDLEALSRCLKALGHPARLQALALLSSREQCCCAHLVDGLPLAQSTVSQHLKALGSAGLISGRSEGTRSAYRLDLESLKQIHQDLGRFITDLENNVTSCCSSPAHHAVDAVNPGKDPS